MPQADPNENHIFTEEEPLRESIRLQWRIKFDSRADGWNGEGDHSSVARVGHIFDQDRTERCSPIVLAA